MKLEELIVVLLVLAALPVAACAINTAIPFVIVVGAVVIAVRLVWSRTGGW